MDKKRTYFLSPLHAWTGTGDLKLYEDASSSQINLSKKANPYGSEHIKIELINQDKFTGHNFSLKYLELVLVALTTNAIWNKITEFITKKSTSRTEWKTLWQEIDNRKLNTLIQTMVHWPNKYFKNIWFLLEQEKYNLLRS